MSKKNLLNESQIRKFMKYANITPLADKFISETYNGLMDEEMDDEMTEKRHKPMEEADDMMEMGGMREDERMEEADMMEGEHEAEVDADADEDMVRDLVVAIAAAIKDKTGVDVAVEAEEEAEMDMDADDAEMDMDAMDADEDAEEADKDAEEMMDMDMDEGHTPDHMEEMVSRIAENVMARVRAVNEDKAKAAKIDQIAESIVARVLKGN